MKYFFLLLLFVSGITLGQGVQGLNYKVMTSSGPTPVMTESGRTVISTGVSPNIFYDWGGGGILGTSRSEGVIVRWTGVIKWPDGAGQRTVNFFSASDDGFFMNINGTNVISSWREQGPSFFNGSGSITLTAGQVYAIDIWWYENGGGAAAYLYWNIGNGTVVVPTTSFATQSTFWVPSLCCGGSSTSFSINPTNSSKINSFTNRITSDSKVYVEQIGNSNDIDITQSGTRNNYVKYYGNGFNNTVEIIQSSVGTSTNYTDVSIVGNSNNFKLTQTNPSGLKSTFVNITDSNNNATILQKDTGSHYLNLTTTGGAKTVNITQQGSASHMADISLSGTTTSLNLTQQGTTQQFYSLQHNCSTAGGCAPITVIQGQ